MEGVVFYDFPALSGETIGITPVSYTHLDVYKRQVRNIMLIINFVFKSIFCLTYEVGRQNYI